jgi:hypothetical protein
MLRFGTDTLGTYINFCSFPTKAFSFLNLREEKIKLKVSIDSSSLPILRFCLSWTVLASKTLILLLILSINSLTWLALSRRFGKLFSRELSFSITSSKVISVLTKLIGSTPTKLSIKVHPSKAGVPKKLPPARVSRTYLFQLDIPT